MARLATTGHELGNLTTTVATSGEAPFVNVGTINRETTVVRTGTASFIAQSSAGRYLTALVPTPTLGRKYFFRAYVRLSDATPVAAVFPLDCVANAIGVGFVQWETNGTLTLRDKNGAQVGSASGVLSDNTWYRIELGIIIPAAGSGTLELYLDGVQVAASAAAAVNNSVASMSIRIIEQSASSTNMYGDDIAINDDTGANQNGYPGPGEVRLLKPVADSAIGTGWVAGGGGATNLWDGVDATPAAGVASASATNTSQIKNANATAGNLAYDAQVTDYTTAGVVGTIKVTEGIFRLGGSSTTGTNNALGRVVSNPADAADTTFTSAFDIVAGTEPTGWGTWKTPAVYNPSVTAGTRPVVRIIKNDASTRVHMADLMGLQVEADGIAATNFTRPQAEAPTITDVATVTLGHPRPQADAPTITDAATRISVIQRPQAEAPTITDSAAVAFARLRPQADTPTITDAANVNRGLPRPQADAPTITDAAVERIGRGQAPAEAPTIHDVASVSAGLRRPQAESPTITDAATVRLGRRQAPAEAPTITDANVRTAVLRRPQAEAPTISDAVQVHVGPQVVRNESPTITDAMVRALVATRTFAEAPTITDAVLRALGRRLTPSEAPSLADQANVRVGHRLTFADGLGIHDSASVGGAPLSPGARPPTGGVVHTVLGSGIPRTHTTGGLPRAPTTGGEPRVTLEGGEPD